MRRRGAAELLSQVILYGGLPMRRVLATEHLGEHAGGPFGADFFAFYPKEVTADPITLDEARVICASADRPR